MRVGFRFSKAEEARFLSHLDIMRTFERSFRRGAIPIKYTEGFNPRPKLVFRDAIPVGVTSSGELAYVDLEGPISPGRVVDALNAVLPSGLRLHEAWKIAAHSKDALPAAKARRLELRFDPFEAGDGESIRANAEKLQASESVVVCRSKGGKKQEIDVRSGISEVSCKARPGGGVSVSALLALNSAAPKARELVDLLLSGVKKSQVEWECEKLP